MAIGNKFLCYSLLKYIHTSVPIVRKDRSLHPKVDYPDFKTFDTIYLYLFQYPSVVTFYEAQCAIHTS